MCGLQISFVRLELLYFILCASTIVTINLHAISLHKNSEIKSGYFNEISSKKMENGSDHIRTAAAVLHEYLSFYYLTLQIDMDNL